MDRSLDFQLQEFAISPVLFPETKERKVRTRLVSCSGSVVEVLDILILRRKATITSTGHVGESSFRRQSEEKNSLYSLLTVMFVEQVGCIRWTMALPKKCSLSVSL